MLVKLTYFKRSGKFYDEGTYETDHKPLYQIWKEVEQLRDHRKLPGLIEGHSYYIVSVDVPEHEYNHPDLII